MKGRNWNSIRLPSVLCFVVCMVGSIPVLAQCPQLQENMDLVRESDRYLLDTPDPARFDSHHFNDAIGPVNDSMPTHEQNYLTVPLTTVDDLNNAKKKADELMKQGKVEFAKKVRVRVATASFELFGQPLTGRELVCLSVAEQLRERGWRCEKRELFDMAAKLYQKVISIYESEVGGSPKTAGVLADLARVQAANKQVAAANLSYNSALKIYDAKPGFADPEMASFFEAYGGFLEDKDSGLSAKMFACAVQVRKYEIRKHQALTAKQRKNPQTSPPRSKGTGTAKLNELKRDSSGLLTLPSSLQRRDQDSP